MPGPSTRSSSATIRSRPRSGFAVLRLEALEERVVLSPAPLHVEGNLLKDSNGATVVLRGVNIPSLEYYPPGVQLLQSLDVSINDWHANVIRLPVNEDYWFGHDEDSTAPNFGQDAYRALVDQVISTASAANVYVVLDLHWSDMGVWGTNNGQHDLPDDHSTMFWQDAAARYANNPDVLFDPYNEPTQTNWQQWHDGGMITENYQGADYTYHSPGMQGLLDTIRATGATNVVVPEGEDYADDLSGITNGYALSDATGNIMYQAHLYPGAAQTDAERDAIVSAVAAKYPLYVGEWGVDDGPNPVTGVPQPDPATFTQRMIAWLDQHQYSWTPWQMNPGSQPRLITDFNTYTPTSDYGVYVKAALTKDNSGGQGDLSGLDLTDTSTPEFRPVGTAVGTFLSTESGSGHTFTYSLVPGVGSADNGSFGVNGNLLVTNDAFDFGARSSYSIRVRTTDEFGQTLEKVFTITIADDPALSLSNRTLTVSGGAGDDVFSIAPGATEHVLTLNGVFLAVDASAVDTVVYQANGGNDTAYLSGGAGTNTLVLWPGFSRLTTSGLTVLVNGAASVAGYGGAGDSVYLVGGSGADTLVETPTYSYLSGTGFLNAGIGFGAAYAYNGSGAGVAYLVGGAEADTVVEAPTYSYLRGAGFLTVASGFGPVYAYGNGGDDHAFLLDGAGSNVFVGTSTYSYLFGSGYFNEAIGFQSVTAYQSAGSSDSAYLHDSAGNDAFVGQGRAAVLYNPTSVNYGAVGFNTVEIYSTTGFDQTYLSMLMFALTESGMWH
jgi:hypothetical protein